MNDGQHRGFSRRALLGSGAAASILAVSAAPAVASGQRALRIAASAMDRDAILRGPGVAPGLTRIGEDGSLNAGLARRHSGENGGRRWRFDLDEEARFHDGAPVTAAAVAEVLRPLLPDARMRRGRGGQLVIELAEPELHLPYRLGHPAYAVVRSDGSGAGSFRVTTGGNGAWLLSPTGGAGRGFEIVHIPDAADRLAALRSRRVELALDLPEDAHPTVAQDDLLLSVGGPDGELADWMARIIREGALAIPHGRLGRTGVTVSLATEVSESAAARPLMRRLIEMADYYEFALTPAASGAAGVHIGLAREPIAADQIVRLPRHAGFAARPVAGPFSAGLIPLDRRFA